MNWHWASGSRRPCLPVLWRKGFPFLAKQKQSSGIEAAILILHWKQRLSEMQETTNELSSFLVIWGVCKVQGFKPWHEVLNISQKHIREKNGGKHEQPKQEGKKWRIRTRPRNISDEWHKYKSNVVSQVKIGDHSSCSQSSARTKKKNIGLKPFSTLILNPALALVSMNMTPKSRDLASPSSIDTCLFDYQKNIVWIFLKIETKIREKSKTMVSHQY